MVAELIAPPPGVDVVETSAGPVWLDDGIVHEAVTIAHLELEHAEALAEAARSLVGDEPSLLLADMRSVRSVASEVRAYSASEAMLSLVAAQAILVGSPVTRVIVSFFVRVFHPPYPVRLFTSPHAALKWLRGLRPAATG